MSLKRRSTIISLNVFAMHTVSVLCFKCSRLLLSGNENFVGRSLKLQDNRPVISPHLTNMEDRSHSCYGMPMLHRAVKCSLAGSHCQFIKMELTHLEE